MSSSDEEIPVAPSTLVVDVAMRGTAQGQMLMETILRQKIYETDYWKEHCFALTAATLVDKAVHVDHVGGVYGGNRKPVPFVCLLLKMLQLQPDIQIAVQFVESPLKYVRVLGATYIRLVATSVESYIHIEPLYKDFRKIRQRLIDGSYSITHLDEIADQLLRETTCFSIHLPRLTKREHLEALGKLAPRKTELKDWKEIVDAQMKKEEQELRQAANKVPEADRRSKRERGRSTSREIKTQHESKHHYARKRSRSTSHSSSNSYDRHRRQSRSRDRNR